MIRECTSNTTDWHHPVVVVCQGRDFYYAVPISTYDVKGAANRGVKKSEHAIIYAGEHRPRPTPAETPEWGEPGMQPVSIKVELEDTRDRLGPRAHVDFGRRICVQYNIRARLFGVVDPVSMDALLRRFSMNWGGSREIRRQGY